MTKNVPQEIDAHTIWKTTSTLAAGVGRFLEITCLPNGILERNLGA